MAGYHGPCRKQATGKLYLQLFHGRECPAEQLEDWGKQGPVFGPLSYVHTTYGEHIKLGKPDWPHDNLGDLYVHDGLVYYDGMWYGDWSVFGEDTLNAELRKRHVPYSASKASIQKEPNGV